MDINIAFGQAFRQHRQAVGLLQESFGDKQSAISRLERGGQWPKPDTLTYAIARIKVPLSTIWATAEAMMRADQPEERSPKRSAREKSEEDAIESRALFRAALSGVVEGVNATTPAAKPALLEFLQAALALSQTRQDRVLYKSLISQVAAPAAPAARKVRASRSRATS